MTRRLTATERRTRDLLARAERICVLTGAGVSTASGIPDFRGPDGLWTGNPKAERISTLAWYLDDDEVRRAAWQYRADSSVWTAEPNAAHRALVRLEATGRLAALITQNTDGLHQAAGSQQVIELHGNVHTWRCETCRSTGSMAEAIARVRAGEEDPRCPEPECGGIIRATTVLFGENLAPGVLDAAYDAIVACDLLLVAGTSLRVYPAANLLGVAQQQAGAQLIIVNGQATAFDHDADAVLRGPIETLLPLLLKS